METQDEQAKMDQLMAELQEEASGNGKGAPGAPEEAGADPEEEVSEQAKMDQLMAELQGEAGGNGKGTPEVPEEAADTTPEAEPDEQAKMDQLMAELQGDKEKEGAEPSGALDQEDAGSGEEVSEQAGMDQLMAELQGEAGSDGKDASGEPEETDTSPEEEPGEQQNMDQQSAELQGAVGESGSDDTQKPDVAGAIAEESDRGSGGNPDGEVAIGQSEEPDEFESLDDDEADLDVYGDSEEDRDGSDQEDTDAEPEPGKQLDIEAGPEPEIRPRPVARKRKSLFNVQAERVSALQEATKQSSWPRIVLICVGITVLIAGLLLGLAAYKNRGDGRREKPVAHFEQQQAQSGVVEKAEAKPEASAQQGTEGAREAPGEYPADHIIQDRFETVDAIRKSLQIKQKEIARLKKDYATGIRQSMNTIADIAADKTIKDFKAAMKVRRIAFELQTIQRRKSYIRKLDVPYNRLLAGNEALLYIRRLTEIDMAVAPFAGGLGTARLLRRIDAEIDKHQLTSDKLLVEAGDLGFPGLKSIWHETVSKRQGKIARGKQAKGLPGGDVLPVEEVKLNNSEIWAQICNGLPDNKYRLTALSADAAQCLANWKGKELFLNRLTGLTPPQARALAAWKGEWIGLNGLTEMDQATARALFKWEGAQLSLNGFSEFPSGSARYLAKWKGKQLELMGLEVLSRKTAVYFSQWKKTGGKLYIPNKFYRRK